ncbi:DNA replication regulator SLD3-domain-containing protein [Fusarium venenatum]|uniref:DNA replication regulator SLD3-domain-containing protein n=1 Tax=Fusarium venenatum TaxID=56646 RepID=UPI001D7044D2|nr:DNA replication regulator SLD3-domain-containing protein [Fusarium venenatum]
MSFSAITGSDASRPARSRILTPSSEGSLNHKDELHSPEKRQKTRADSVTMDHLLKPSIAVKPHPPKLHIQPRILHPLMVLPRERLPLSCIDFHATNVDLATYRLFEANIKILDLESRMGSVPVVLLARKEGSRAVYALEKQESGLYVVCRLGPWVNLDLLADSATAVCRERLHPTTRSEHQNQNGPSAITTPHIHKEEKMKRAAIEAFQSQVRKRPRSQSVSTLAESVKQEATEAATPTESKLPSPIIQLEELKGRSNEHTAQSLPVGISSDAKTEEPPKQQTAEDIFDTLRTQYFDMLYKSMGSLAYFAKGPLSRARSAFHLDLESNLNLADLIEFLKSLVLTTVQIDKKYRQTIPALIAQMKTMVESSDEGRKRKRRARKMKIGKDGLYPHEQAHIRKWWATNQPELKDDETNVSDHQTKSITSMLHTRETQLQMIIILEILALTPLKPADDAEDSQLPLLPGAAESQGDMAPPSAKKRNKHNLPMLVDVHADRLTIWHTASDQQLLLEDSQVSQTLDGQSQQKSSSEPLKDFCVDIIVPFFSHRLPELCDLINRKLGGPVIVKPSRPKTLRRPSSKQSPKPGTVAKRSVSGQPTRTLQRALSTDQQFRRSASRGPSNMIALMRSATTTALPGIKREASDPALVKSVLGNDPDLMNRKSGPLPRSSSASYLQDAKMSKKAQVEAELRDAISSLRKPNRQVVGQALAEAAERRATVSSSAKKARKPIKGSFGTPVVKATPANVRFKDVFASRANTMETPLMSTEDVIPPSSLPSMVPSTGYHGGGQRNAFRQSRTPDFERIGSTPTKTASTFIRRPADDPDVLPFPPSSPCLERRTVSAANLFNPTGITDRKRKVSFESSLNDEILATPVKAIKTKSIEDLKNIRMEPAPAKQVSIYQKLGWDDDIDDLL